MFNLSLSRVCVCVCMSPAPFPLPVFIFIEKSNTVVLIKEELEIQDGWDPEGESSLDSQLAFRLPKRRSAPHHPNSAKSS